jgi:hypothetical protein
MFKIGLIQVVMFLPAVVGLVIGIIAIIKIARYRRMHGKQVQVDGTESVDLQSLSEYSPWINNGFVCGLFMGFAIGIGFMAPFTVIWTVKTISSSSSGIPTAFTCIWLITGIGLAYLLGRIANKKIASSGLDGIGDKGKGIGHLLLAILGMIDGFWTGLVCLAILVSPIVILSLLSRI